MSCDPERITGYVDGALDPEARAAVEEHLATCPACRDQVEFERGVRERLRGLPATTPAPGLEPRIRRRLAAEHASAMRWLLPLAACLTLAALWTRGFAPLVAWELARDHAHCFGLPRLPAQVVSDDPARVSAWFEDHGTLLPVIPAHAGGLELVGGRYCWLPDGTRAAHVYYGGEEGHLSMFVIARGVRVGGGYRQLMRGENVDLSRLGGLTVGLVSEDVNAIGAFRERLTTTVASRAEAARFPAD